MERYNDFKMNSKILSCVLTLCLLLILSNSSVNPGCALEDSNSSCIICLANYNLIQG
jgi:hypothetical protein